MLLISIVLIMILLALFCYSIIPTLFLKLKQRLSSKELDEKILYLTFDDGPDQKYTGQLLNLLEKYQVKASFFVVAKFAKENPLLIERMKKNGHTIGLHSLEHKNGLWQTPSYTKKDFTNSMGILKSLGVDAQIFRPPWGHFNLFTLRSIKANHLTPVLWDVMAEDWSGNTTYETISKKLQRRVKNGSIICLHDGRGKNDAPSRTILALEQVIPVWIDQGYRFLTLGEKHE